MSFEAFQQTEIRVATVIQALPFPEARIPAIKLELDFGEGTRRWSSAQITAHYSPEQLVGRQVLALVGIPTRRIAGFKSECLTLGLPDENGEVVLIGPDQPVPIGGRVY